MPNRIYAMDTHFMKQDPPVSLEEQIRLVKEAGYADYYVTASVGAADKINEYREAAAGAGLGFNAVYLTMDLAIPFDAHAEKAWRTCIEKMRAPTRLELAVNFTGIDQDDLGNPRHDEEALMRLRQILPILEDQGIDLCLYPHFGYWIETTSDALRLACQLDHPGVGIMFCAYHWYRIHKEPDLKSLLKEALPKLRGVNLCGSRWRQDRETPSGSLNPTIEPLDAGTMDCRTIVETLKRLGYGGPFGIQGYDVTAPPGEALQRSLRQLKAWL